MPNLEVLIGNMTRKEIANQLDKVKLFIIPVGSTEQHNTHLPLQHDTAQVCFIAEEVASRLYPQVLVTPPVAIGLSEHHMKRGMTLTLQPENFVNIIVDLCNSLKYHGVERVVILNGHGGNRDAKLWGGGDISPIEVATEKARHFGLKATTLNWWDVVLPSRVTEIIEHSFPGHAGETETSLGLFMYPDKVNRVEMENCDSPEVHAATVEKGKIIFEEVVKRLVLFMEEFIQNKIDDVYYHPYGSGRESE